ncbi:MAG: ligase-associated DNA damage response endonuclease PdeM [Beijerinckiaceae bacterium]|nr:ligase-associated DNA damage response endonuclease PdeM [Beijerinckiaceae bacterium]
MNLAVVEKRTPTAPARLNVGGVAFLADISGALFLEDERLLIVADLHLEKGSAYAARRVLLPPYDTAATLARLASVVLRLAPRAVIALGDSFHDVRAGERMAEPDRCALAELQRGRDFIWVAGNHDPEVPAFVDGERCATFQIGAVTLRHEPMAGASAEIAGHLHPVARVVSKSGGLRRRCFASDGKRCVMPAFGAYAGGLNIRDAAFAPLFPAGVTSAHVLGRSAVYGVGPANCWPD